MISDLDESIKQLLIKKGAFDPAEVEISFEAPDREWTSSLSKPAINVYLYDIRENHQLRTTDWSIERDTNGIATRKQNPGRIDLAYLITVWANAIDDEHRLLWHTLLVLFRYPTLPEELLQGQLAGQKYPIKTSTAQPDGLLKNPADFWGALDNQLKPTISYTVTVPLDLDITFTAPIVKTKTIEVKGPDGVAEQLVQIAGTVRTSGKSSQAIPQAVVIAKEVRKTVKTDKEGHYIFPKLPLGKHTIQVIVPGRKVWEKTIAVPSENYDLEV